jgi:hypothetical protein
LGPAEEANPATDKASTPFQMKIDAISKVVISVWKQA